MRSLKYIVLLVVPALAFILGAAVGQLLGVSKELCNWTVVEILALLFIGGQVWLIAVCNASRKTD